MDKRKPWPAVKTAGGVMGRAEGHGDERTDEKGRRPLEGTNGGGINCGFQDRKQTGRSSAPA